MSVKYEVENTKLNKKLIGDEISLSRINKPHGDGGQKPGKDKMTLTKLANIVIKIDQKLDRVIEYNNLKS